MSASSLRSNSRWSIPNDRRRYQIIDRVAGTDPELAH
jgi:hypothetical protein